jgi:hypothetical protein
VTRASLREDAAVQRERYQHAARAEKRRLLDETVAVTGMHRKAAIRLLPRAARADRPVARRPAAMLWPPCGRRDAARVESRGTSAHGGDGLDELVHGLLLWAVDDFSNPYSLSGIAG